MPRVVIVGGGPAGAVLAMTLARRGLKPVILEALEEPASKIGECLPPNANPLLERLGIKERLRREEHLNSFGNRSVWGSAIPFERDFLFGTNGRGWQLDRRKFEQTLATMALESGAEWHGGSRLRTCSWQDGRWVLSIKTASGDETREADFVVDATGRTARLARQLGASQMRSDRLMGAAVLFKAESLESIKDSFTLVEAVASGWWYSARLPSNHLIAIYMTDSDLIDHNAVRHHEGWAALLKGATYTSRRVLCGDYQPTAAPRLLPANSTRLNLITGERWLAVGDAAAAYDPLASYGISAALGAGFHAASAIADFLAGKQDALPSYAGMIEQAYEQYLAMHQSYYDLEQRWPHEPFWRRRHLRRLSREETSAGAVVQDSSMSIR